MREGSARLDAEGVTWGAHKGMPIISSISLSVDAGDRLAIIGPNGAGKSTLLRCLYRGVKPQRGTVRLDGVDLWSIGPRQAAQRIAVVPQETPSDFPFSVRDVVLMGRIPHRKGMARWSDHDHEVTTQALARLELAPLALRQFASLSGGEKQRALIARALAQEPELIILDEPTNHLDIRHQLEILELLKGLGRTIITTLHDINLAADFATHVAVLDCGRLTGHGQPTDVLTVEHISSAFRVGASLHQQAGGEARRFSFSLR